jgi:hypothetical protein
MHSCSGHYFEAAGFESSSGDAPELSGPLGNLLRLLFSEAWRAKAQTPNPGHLNNLSRDFMRRNVATNHNIPQIALSQ